MIRMPGTNSMFCMPDRGSTVFRSGRHTMDIGQAAEESMVLQDEEPMVIMPARESTIFVPDEGFTVLGQAAGKSMVFEGLHAAHVS